MEFVQLSVHVTVNCTNTPPGPTGDRRTPAPRRRFAVAVRGYGSLMSDFTHLNLLDVEDLAPGHGLSAIGEARFAREALGCTASGLSHQRLLPGARQPFGHRHAREEEIYLVLSGSGRMRLDDEVIDVAALDAIRVAPAVMRAFAAGPDGLEVVAFGAPGLGGPDAQLAPGWWEDDGGTNA